jgi:thiol:disulfide interchange protein DsbD
METFKQTMAFPLYGTVVFLAWVMAGQLEENAMLSALLGLVLVAMAAWAYGRWTQNGAGRIRRVAGFSVAAMLLAVGLGIGMPRISPHGVQWREWSPELVERLRADGEVVYVDFTARWCATCKVNKLAVFSSGDVLEEFERAGVVALKADWTRRNPDITAELERFGRSAVPFTLVYGPANAEPIVLPEVLTPGVVLDAIERVGRQTLDVCQESGRDSPGMVASVGR